MLTGNKTKNMMNIKQKLYNVLSKINRIRVTNIATTISEAINIIKKESIDLILLDLNLPDATGIELINNIRSFNFIKKPTIIIISSELPLIKKAKNEESFSIINKIESSDYILKQIAQTIEEMQYYKIKENLNKDVLFYLSTLGYNFKRKGTMYIAEAILFIYKSNNLDLLDNLEKNVYKYVALKNKKSINNIKTNIIKATNLIPRNNFYQNDLTPKIIISDIVLKLINDYSCQKQNNQYNHFFVGTGLNFKILKMAEIAVIQAIIFLMFLLLFVIRIIQFK